MALSILQANVNHSARAQDLLLQSVAEWLIDVAMVSEPYSVPPRENWVGDRTGMAALVSRTGAGLPPFEHIVRGGGYAAAVLGDVTLVSVYFSPNRSLSDFEQFLLEVGVLVGQRRTVRVIVAGDLNAKSMAWGCPATDGRGEAVEEWALTAGLTVVNRGSVNTCVRQQGGSIVDVTFADAALARCVHSWEVQEDVETLSDHLYIRFSVSTLPGTPTSPIRPLEGTGPKWAIKRLDYDALEEAVIVEAWLHPGVSQM
ncbi:uncharacterized protein LOC126372638 [Pectinophora gossypiella]|uniref:uncharacterized protein LOC126372638 n=1 Tax=Pectinophora gossypiella TaxID=13191 RepID=UPI00214E5015|nr:uncharacterized protein LOC126372638 [Pectinophora gossypiella]